VRADGSSGIHERKKGAVGKVIKTQRMNWDEKKKRKTSGGVPKSPLKRETNHSRQKKKMNEILGTDGSNGKRRRGVSLEKEKIEKDSPRGKRWGSGRVKMN